MSDSGEPLETPSSDADTHGVDRRLSIRSGDLLCNRFRILRFIARGGMGELYEAEDLTLGEHIALKTILPDIARDPRVTQRFRREVQLARKVTHANICRIFDLFEHVPLTDGPGPSACAFVTMELLHGETLSQRLNRKGAFTIPEALPLITQMASALGAAHAVGIVHRDFKSNNVMLVDATGSRPTRVVVTDFGLAHRMEEYGTGDFAAITGSGDLLGTPDYMAPEQVEGQPVTPSTDVYALGIVLYEILTGRRPFKADTPLAAALLRVTGPPPPPPRRLNPEVPAAWDRTIMRCLARRPEDRFPDATAVAEALELPGSVASGSETAIVRTGVRAWSVGLVAVAVVAALLIGGGVVQWLNRSGTSSNVSPPIETVRPAVAVLGFRNLAGRGDVQWLSTALSEMLTTEVGAAEKVRTVPGENVNRMKTELSLADADAYNAETLARIRRNVGADIVVSGSYVTVGEGDGATLRVDIRVQDARKGQTLSLVSETGKSAELLDLVARAGGQLRDRLGMAAAPGVMMAARASQPSSPDAARLYAEGLIRLRRYDALGARTLFEQTIQADPAFPLAYSALATTWSTLGYDTKAKDAATQAFQFAANLSRADRLQVEGTFHEMAKEWKEAIAIWQTLATFFADDVEFALRLANAQIVSGAAKDGLATLEGFKRRFPSIADPRLDLAEALAAETLSDFKRMQAAAAAAAAAGQAHGATLLVAAARLREAIAFTRSGNSGAALTLLEESRALYANAGDLAGVARVLNSLAASSEGSDTKRRRALYEEGLGMSRAIGNQDLVARFLNNIAIEERNAGNLQSSLTMNQESLAIRREIGDATNAAVSLNNIGNVLLDLDDLQMALRSYEESASMSREIGDRRSMARALFNAGAVFNQLGELARSKATNEESLEIRREISDPVGIATSLHGLGEVAALQGDLAAARRLFEEALEMDRKLDRQRPIGYSLFQLGEIARLQGDLVTARRRHQEALDLRQTMGEQGTASESSVAIALVDLAEGKSAEAESLAREAASVFSGQRAAGAEAMARAALALALLAQAKRDAAAHEVARVQAIVKPQQVLVRLFTAIAVARVTAGRDVDRALRALESVRAEAVQRGIPKFEFEARQAIVEIEGRRSVAAGQKLLEELRRDARARGFGLYAR